MGSLTRKQSATNLLLLVCFVWGVFSHAAILSAAPLPAPVPANPTITHHSKRKSKKTRRIAGKRRGPSQTLPDADRTSQIQSALARGGYYNGDPSGKWDPDTVAALQKFQSANGLDSKGKLDAPTLQRLGLGSEIAGVSAPHPSPGPGASSVPNASTSAPLVAPGASAPPAAAISSKPGISTN